MRWAVLLVALLTATSAEAQEPRFALPDAPKYWLAFEVQSAFLSDVINGTTEGLTFGVGGRAGVRFERHEGARTLGVFFSVETNFWREPEISAAGTPFVNVPQGALFLGLGVESIFAHGRVRFAASGGITSLLFNTRVDQHGTLGFFVDLRPTGIRIKLPRVVFSIDPLTFTLSVPDTGGIPLVLIEFRTVLTIEFGVGSE